MSPTPRFLYDIIGQLRRRGLQLGVDDYLDLQCALAAGIGLTSDVALRQTCVALWAKSTAEAEMIDAAFAGADVPQWSVPGVPSGDPLSGAGAEPTGASGPDVDAGPKESPASDHPAPDPIEPASPTTRGLPGLVRPPPRTGRRGTRLILAPQYPVALREIIQVWRGLRRPTRHGPPIELDVDATLARLAGCGVRTAPVLVAARRNTTRLLLLIDRQGSMAPFHDFVDHIHRAMRRAGRFDALTAVYFHNLAGSSRSHGMLAEHPDPFSPALDPILGHIAPLTAGRVYEDPDLTVPLELDAVFSTVTLSTSTVVISDAGSARGGLNVPRLLDTLAMVKALRAATAGLVWLNPVAPTRWTRTTAGQVARHVPMFPLTRDGMDRAVDALRGRPVPLERAL